LAAAILFDFDGVVADTFADNYAAWSDALAPFGIQIGAEEYALMEGRRAIDVARTFCRVAGVDAGRAEAILAEKERLYRTRARLRISPGVEVVLDALRARGIPAALVSGAGRERFERSVPASLRARFAAVVLAEDVERAKPDPEPYTRAMAALGVDADASIAVENAPLGVLSARSAGAYVLAVASTLPPSRLQEADEVLPDHAALWDRVLDLAVRGAPRRR
jgi:HAD superfamily hydrolase (TIGR01509 family)